MTPVTDGIALSAFHSTRCLTGIADKSSDEEIKYHMRHGFYVDDFFGGCNSTNEARILIHKVCEVLHAYGFPLRKWLSNPNLIRELPAQLRESADVQLFSKSVKGTCNVLETKQGYFLFHHRFGNPQNLTKKTMLSLNAKLFDPRGFLSPIIVKFKILIQQIWSHDTN